MSEHDDMICVILAGGRGKRMASEDCHKVCFPIAGRPAIVRAIDTYKEAGLRHFVVVVGQMSEQVMATVTDAHPEVVFAFQREPRGTGHAALVAVEALAAQGFEGHIMLVMGDKVTRAATVREFIQRYREKEPGLLMTCLPKVAGSSAGRVLTREDGSVVGLVESADIRQAQEQGTDLSIGRQRLAPEEVERRSLTVNASMYLYPLMTLRAALRHLSPSNAQGELYLTDTVALLAEDGTVDTMLVPDPEDIMAFNTPAELLAVEEVVLRREGRPMETRTPREVVEPAMLKPAKEWLAILEQGGSALDRTLTGIYGDDPTVRDERRQAMLKLVQAFIGQFGPDRLTVVCRAPGRVNLMGRHVDHRGGFVNVMAINREALVVAAPREDDVVRLRHLDVTQFPNREFRIYDLLSEESWSEWMDFLESSTVQRVLQSAPGDWSHYVRAPLLRLQYEHAQTRLHGMDCMVSGNIPMGAGLSSSSALVVAFAEAAVVLNGLDVAMRDFVDLCGEGEWFVGSRGGSADHAAIRTGQLGHVSSIGFFPFRLAGEVPFPSDCRVIIAHSGLRAIKSAGARDVFNQRVACYEIAEMLLRAKWPAAAGMAHLRDLAPARLGVEPADLYRALILLPKTPSRDDLHRLMPPALHSRLDQLLATHDDVGLYNLRGTALFGISECVRSEGFADLLRDGDFGAIRKSMLASHDGDRAVRWKDGKAEPFKVDVDDAALRALAAKNADPAICSGAYACSTESIDLMVDLTAELPGVIGAQLAGAGLGGCMMVLAREDGLEIVKETLTEQYYRQRDAEPDIHVCSPVEGAGMLRMEG